MADADTNKAALRKAMKAWRDGVSPQDHLDARASLAAHWATIPRGPWTSGYLPIGSELDPTPLLTALAAHGSPLCLPVVQGRGRPLTFRAWSPGDELETAQWGLREPSAAQAAVTPNVMLVPLLAVDRRGNRLGYGAGYYDRSIAGMRTAGQRLLTIGLAFPEQIIDAVPHLDYDVPLDAILTPSELIWCQGAA